MQYVRLGMAWYATVADALTLGATHSKLEGGRVPSPWSPPSSLLAALFSHTLCCAAFALPFAQWGSANLTLPLPPPCWYQSTDPP